MNLSSTIKSIQDIMRKDDGVGGDYPADVRTRETADMVLPDGLLFGDGIKAKVKEWLLEHCNLHTVVRLPMARLIM
jgi:type I restriction enzyme M protein